MNPVEELLLPFPSLRVPLGVLGLLLAFHRSLLHLDEIGASEGRDASGDYSPERDHAMRVANDVLATSHGPCCQTGTDPPLKCRPRPSDAPVSLPTRRHALAGFQAMSRDEEARGLLSSFPAASRCIGSDSSHSGAGTPSGGRPYGLGASALRNLAVAEAMAAISRLDLGPNSGLWLGRGL
jgi:hypothetical protein